MFGSAIVTPLSVVTMTKTGSGRRVEEPPIGFNHGFDQRIGPAIRGELSDGCFELLTLGRHRLPNAELSAGTDQDELVLAWQLFEESGQPGPQAVQKRRHLTTRIDHESNAHRAVGARCPQHLAGNAVFEELEIACGEVDDRRSAGVRGRHVDAPLYELGHQRRRGAERERDDGERGSYHGCHEKGRRIDSCT
jgi:hypothetical protein